MACAEPARRQAPYGDDCAEPLPAAPSNCPAVASLRGTATMPPRSREVWQSGADVGRVWWVQVTVHGASRLADFLVDWNAFRAAARRPIAPGHPVCPPSAPASPAPHPSRAAGVPRYQVSLSESAHPGRLADSVCERSISSEQQIRFSSVRG